MNQIEKIFKMINFGIVQMVDFLTKGDKVRLLLNYRGREMAHPEIGEEVINRMLASVEEISILDMPPLFDAVCRPTSFYHRRYFFVYLKLKLTPSTCIAGGLFLLLHTIKKDCV